jgi:hypothetical protein
MQLFAISLQNSKKLPSKDGGDLQWFELKQSKSYSKEVYFKLDFSEDHATKQKK